MHSEGGGGITICTECMVQSDGPGDVKFCYKNLCFAKNGGAYALTSPWIWPCGGSPQDFQLTHHSTNNTHDTIVNKIYGSIFLIPNYSNSPSIIYI